MTPTLSVLFFLVATLYAAVGHGGGSGYLAVMGLAGVSPEIMKPTALTLNILVTTISTWKYVRAGQFSFALYWPFVVTSIPFAFLGGRLSLPSFVYRPIVGLVLLYAAVRLWRSVQDGVKEHTRRHLPLWAALLAGMGIGLISGLVGVGGGIFLGPLLLLAGWAETRPALGITAAFVLANSIAGLLGFLSSVPSVPAGVPFWLAAAGLGGWVGAEYGSRRLDPNLLRRLLALVLVVGGVRMFVG